MSLVLRPDFVVKREFTRRYVDLQSLNQGYVKCKTLVYFFVALAV